MRLRGCYALSELWVLDAAEYFVLDWVGWPFEFLELGPCWQAIPSGAFQDKSWKCLFFLRNPQNPTR